MYINLFLKFVSNIYNPTVRYVNIQFIFYIDYFVAEN
jgi:hypothetical protein